MENHMGRLAIAEAIARKAGIYALHYFQSRDRLSITSKGLQDMVSQADRETEELIRKELAVHFPEDGVLGEEDGLKSGRSGRTWVVDPIDGTWCFVNGIGSWCISIACIQGDETLIGAIFDPNSGEMFSASKDQGAWLDGRPIRVKDAENLQAGTLSTGFSHRSDPKEIAPVIEEILAKGGQFHRHGSGALGLAWTAAGRLIGYLEPHMNSWDCLAGLLMIREAGGKTCDFLLNDGLMNGGPVVASNPTIWPELSHLARHFRLAWQ